MTKGYIIALFKNGKVFIHSNRVSLAAYVYQDIAKADKKAYEIEATDKTIQCLVVELTGVIA